MSEHLTAEDIELFRRRKLTPRRLLAVSQHLAECALCRPALPAQPVTLWAAGIREHLSEEQLDGYAAGTLGENDRQVVERPLEACPQCQADVRDLKSLAAGLARFSARPPRASIGWDRLRARPWFPAAAAAAMVVVLVTSLT